jgi:hypothetical protein
LGPDESKIVSALASAVRNPDSKTENDECSLLDRLIKASNRPCAFWLYLYGSFIRIGHARAAHKAKLNAADILLKGSLTSPPASQDELRNVLAAACYAQAFETGASIFARFERAQPDDWSMTRLLVDLLLCEGRVEEARAHLRDVEFSKSDRKYKKLLASRRCAVVGPAKNDLKNGEKIDAHDLVVRTNFAGSGAIEPHYEMLGRRTDIVYYNGPALDRLGSHAIQGVRDAGLKFLITRKRNQARRLAKLLPEESVRHWLSFKKSDFIGAGFAMRHILFDMMLFADEPVSVLGADFYLGATAHYSGYFEGDVDVAYQFCRHDPLDTFMFMRALFKAGAINPDRVLEDILSLDVEDFTRRLSERLAG